MNISNTYVFSPDSLLIQCSSSSKKHNRYDFLVGKLFEYLYRYTFAKTSQNKTKAAGIMDGKYCSDTWYQLAGKESFHGNIKANKLGDRPAVTSYHTRDVHGLLYSLTSLVGGLWAGAPFY